MSLSLEIYYQICLLDVPLNKKNFDRVGTADWLFLLIRELIHMSLPNQENKNTHA